MERIGVRELRQNASRYLKRVEAGETIEVADRGRPVARLLPIIPGGWDQLVSEGRLRPAEGHLRDLGPPLPLPPGVEAPSDVLDRMRDE
jgi:prevent-host-death family protein